MRLPNNQAKAMMHCSRIPLYTEAALLSILSISGLRKMSDRLTFIIGNFTLRLYLNICEGILKVY